MPDALHNADPSADAAANADESVYRHPRVQELAALISQGASPWLIDKLLSEIYYERLLRIRDTSSELRGAENGRWAATFGDKDEAKLDRLMDSAIKGARESLGIEMRKRAQAAAGIPVGGMQATLRPPSGVSEDDFRKVLAILRRRPEDGSPCAQQEPPASERRDEGGTDGADQQSVKRGAVSKLRVATCLYVESLQKCFDLEDQLEEARCQQAATDRRWKDRMRAVRLGMKNQANMLRQVDLLMSGIAETVSFSAQIAVDETRQPDGKYWRGLTHDEFQDKVYGDILTLMIENIRYWKFVCPTLLECAAEAGVDLGLPEAQAPPARRELAVEPEGEAP